MIDSRSRQRLLWAARGVAAMTFVVAGLNHFRSGAFYESIIPPIFPGRRALVQISGIAEIAGGIGLLIAPLRRFAGWGLIALLIAVFPANIYMAVAPEKIPEMNFPRWALWLRLPIQFLLIAWVWFVSIRRPAKIQPRS